MQGLGHTADYYYLKLVWVDICNSVRATSAMKAAEQALSRKGRKGWMSKSKKNENYNLRGADKALKLNSCDAVTSKHACEHCASSGRGQNTWAGE